MKKPECLTCHHLVLWDKDWCCCADMSVLSLVENGKLVSPKELTCDRSSCQNYSKEEWPNIVDSNREIFKQMI